MVAVEATAGTPRQGRPGPASWPRPASPWTPSRPASSRWTDPPPSPPPPKPPTRPARPGLPAGGGGPPADVAHAVSFLAPEDAGFIIGQRIVVDGGRSLGS